MSLEATAPETSPAALAAFLRGSERRAAVLAQLQCGDAQAGDAAVVNAMREFYGAASAIPMSGWPAAFWTLLLAQPQLRTRTAVALPLEVTDRLGEIGAGPRAALLLRLAAGLDEATAAAVLGVREPSYRLALQRALPRDADGRANALAWQRMSEQVHRFVQSLPQERLRRLGAARAEAPHPVTQTWDGMVATPVGGSRRKVLITLWVALALCAVALAATFRSTGVAPPRGAAGGPDSGMIRLPDERPASTYGVETGLVSHRDFALLADPQALPSGDVGFYSWLAAQQGDEALPEPPPASPIPIDNPNPADFEAGPSETADAPD